MSYLKLSKDSNRVLSSNLVVLSTEYMRGIPFAIYSEDDGSLTFYASVEVPQAGERYAGKTATKVYEIDVDNKYSNSSIPWRDEIDLIKFAKIDESFNSIKPSYTSFWFYSMQSCESIDVRWLNAENIVDASYMFSNCHNLNEIQLGDFYAPVLKTAIYMFYMDYALSTVDIANMKAPSVENIIYFFGACHALREIDLSGFEGAPLSDIYGLCYQCYYLREIDVSMLDTSSVTNMTNVFAESSALRTIYSDDSKFTNAAVSIGSQTFRGCTNLVGGNGTAYSSDNVSYTMAHVDVPGNPGYFTAKGD